MSDLPGYTVTIGNRASASLSARSDSTGFLIGLALKGPINEAKLVTSSTQYEEIFGPRSTGFERLYDYVDVAFREGATAIYVVRLGHEGKIASASKEAVDTESKKSLKITAIYPGEWGNNLKAKIVLATTFTVTVEYEGSTVETSPAFTTKAEAVAWAVGSSYIRIEELSEGTIPKTQTLTLSGGEDGHTEVASTDAVTGLAAFKGDLGPGQVAAPGYTTEAFYLAVLAHAASKNRRALLDGPNTGTQGTIISAATALRGAPSSAARFGAMLAPWAIVPGVSLGTTRTVPYSAVQMGLTARAEAEGAGADDAVAGVKRASARYATGLTQTYAATAREELNTAGVIVAVLVRGTPTTFGNKTLVNPVTDPTWVNFANSRLVMAVAAAVGNIMEGFEFDKIDDLGHIFSDLEGSIVGVCTEFYLEDALYGQTPQEAFSVNCGPSINTEATIAKGELKAQVVIKASPNGEELSAEIIKIAISEPV